MSTHKGKLHSLMYTADDYRAALSLIPSGAANTDGIITATYPLEEAGWAFAASVDPEQVKVIVTTVTAGRCRAEPLTDEESRWESATRQYSATTENPLT
ncbi:hypothetical protein ACH4TX_43050 [Streptomyces sp. NPDC021098]|uniref:hypothetical protein n=1 Tax=unclassified Streptomyces TaxID=2593676 RepID=UPI00378F9C5F